MKLRVTAIIETEYDLTDEELVEMNVDKAQFYPIAESFFEGDFEYKVEKIA